MPDGIVMNRFDKIIAQFASYYVLHCNSEIVNMDI